MNIKSDKWIKKMRFALGYYSFSNFNEKHEKIFNDKASSRNLKDH